MGGMRSVAALAALMSKATIATLAAALTFVVVLPAAIAAAPGPPQITNVHGTVRGHHAMLEITINPEGLPTEYRISYRKKNGDGSESEPIRPFLRVKGTRPRQIVLHVPLGRQWHETSIVFWAEASNADGSTTSEHVAFESKH